MWIPQVDNKYLKNCLFFRKTKLYPVSMQDGLWIHLLPTSCVYKYICFLLLIVYEYICFVLLVQLFLYNGDEVFVLPRTHRILYHRPKSYSHRKPQSGPRKEGGGDGRWTFMFLTRGKQVSHRGEASQCGALWLTLVDSTLNTKTIKMITMIIIIFISISKQILSFLLGFMSYFSNSLSGIQLQFIDIKY